MPAGPLRGSKVVLVALLLTSVVLGATGCGEDGGSTETEASQGASSETTSDEASDDATGDGGEESAEASATDEEPVPDPSTSPDVAIWIEGTWTIESTVTAVDPEWMGPAADQSLSRWNCTVDGTSMTIETGRDAYEGTLTVDGDSWTFQGTSSYTDSSGIKWTSDLSASGTRTGDDSFTAVTSGAVSSDTGGGYYSATWEQVGTRE
jgi:hypothetical protein